MNVYINKSAHSYSGGLIIVAANSIDEAHGLMCKYDEFLEYINIYRYENWELAKDLVYIGTEPKVIKEDNYTE